MTTRTLQTDTPGAADLSHIVLRTTDVEACVDFYGKLLGMRVQGGDGKSAAALSHDGEHHRLLLMGVAPADVDPAGPGVEHIAFKMRGMPELLGNYKRVKELGIEPALRIHHGGTLSMYYLDPAGVQIELFIDIYPTDISIEAMNSPEFAKNPIGVPVDFDELVRRYEAGEAMTSLYEKPEEQEGDFERMLQEVIAARGGSIR